MGRQKGKQQRTKGNVVPSSSARSADLLSKQGGNSHLQNLSSGILGSVPELEGLESIANPDLRIAMKKLYKRDVTTKLKALSEFSGLCESIEEADVLTTLPYWPRVYNRLFEDADRRVREAAQKALHSIVKSAGKNLAPHLKSFMGYWFLSQCDPYAPTAFSAEAALAHAFRGPKRIDAFVFCREEIIGVITFYLFRTSLQYSAQDKNEGENNGYRILSCALEALALYVNTVSKHKPVDEEVRVILDNSQFWKFQKHKHPPVRGAFYSVLESLCLQLPEVLKEHLKEACKATFHRFDETHASIAKPLYSVAVALSGTYENWYEYVDFNRGVLPSICSALKNGCHGLCSIILPSLLPLLSKFPLSNNLLHNYEKIFEALHECLRHDQVYSSKRNLRLALATFVELLQLLVSQVNGMEKVKNMDEVVRFVVSKNLLHILGMSFADSKLSHNGLYESVATALQSWTAKKYTDKNKEFYVHLCSTFWRSFSFHTHHHLIGLTLPQNTECNPVSSILQFLFELLRWHPLSSGEAGTKKKLGVAFVDEKIDACPVVDASEHDDKFRTSSEFIDIQESVNTILVNHIFHRPLEKAELILKVQRDVLEKFANKDLFERILQKNDVSFEGKKKKDPALHYLNHVLIADVERIASLIDVTSDSNMCEILSGILYHCLAHCENLNTMPHCLKSFFQAGNKDTKFLISFHLSRKLSSRSNSSKVLWVRNEFQDKNSSIIRFISTVMENMFPVTCKNKDISETVVCQEGWTLLIDLFTVQHESKEGTVYLCSQKSFHFCMCKLLKLLKSSKDACTCLECFTRDLLNVSKLLLACKSRGFNLTPLNDDSTNVWSMLITSQLQMYCLIEKEHPDTLSMLTDCIDHINSDLNSDSPVTDSIVFEFLQTQMKWLKENFILNSHVLPQWSMHRVNKLVKAVCSRFPPSSLFFSAAVDNLLPSEAEWSRIRMDVGCEYGAVVPHRLPYLGRNELSTREDELSIDEKLYVSVVNSYHDLCMLILPSEGCFEENASVLGKIQLLCEEGLIASSMTNKNFDAGLVSKLGKDFEDVFQCSILEKSNTIGNIWPQSLFQIKGLLVEEACQNVLASFTQSLKDDLGESQPSQAELETVLALTSILQNTHSMCLPEVIINHISTRPASEVSKPDIELFSLGARIVSRSENISDIERYFEQILIWRKEREDLFLFEADLTSAPDEIILLNIHVALIFKAIVVKMSVELSESQWDFICCLLVSWAENLATYMANQIQARALQLQLLSACCQVDDAVSQFMSSPVTRDDPTVPRNLTSEWMDFFSVSVHTSFVRIFLTCAGNNKYRMPNSTLWHLCQSLSYATASDVMASVVNLKPKLSASSNLPNTIQTILNHLAPMLLPTDKLPQNCLIQSTAYSLLCTLLPQIKQDDGSISAPAAITNVIEKSLSSIEPVFVSQNVEQPKSRNPVDSEEENETDEEYEVEAGAVEKPDVMEQATPVLGYLFSWKLLLKLTRQVPNEQKSSYVDSLMSRPSLHLSDDLLPKLFKLMPEKLSSFKNEPKLFYDRILNQEDIKLIACSVYKDYLLEMPAAARVWFNNLPKVARNRVDKFTSTFVSPVLIERELTAIQLTKRKQATEGMNIIARPQAHEVCASYKINEIEMEIVVCLSPNHPLGPIAVNTEKRAGVVMGQWRYWILQITTFLQYQNGGIIDGLLLWKDKVDKRFEGLEECMICFSVVHGSNQTLPKLKCKTCKKKYHPECLYKWFDTSNNSTCPLCRSPMIFR